MATTFDKYIRLSVTELKNLGLGTLVRFSAKPTKIEVEGWDWVWIFKQDKDAAAVFLIRETINSNEEFVKEYFKDQIPELFKNKEYSDLVDWEGAATIYGRVINQDPTIVIAHFVFPRVIQNLLDKKKTGKIAVRKITQIPKKDLDRRVAKIIQLLKIEGENR